MNMVWDIHGAAYYEQLWLTVPCSDDSTVFCFHFWRLSGLHVVPFKGCLGGSCILLCAYEREMNFSVPKYCKRGYVKRLHAAIEEGKYPLQTMWLPVYKIQIFWTSLWNVTQDFLCFPEQCPAWDEKDFFESTVLGEWDFFEAVHLKSPVCFPNFNLPL